MTSVDSNPQHERIRLSPALFVVLGSNGITFSSAARPDDVALGLEELTLLQAIAGAADAHADTIVDRVAASTGRDADAVRHFVDSLQADGVFGPFGSGWEVETDRGQAPATPASSLSLGDEPVLLETPLVFRITAAGFECLDHEGRTRTRLSSVELAAVAELPDARTLSLAFERHCAVAGEAALSREDYQSCIERLVSAGIVTHYEHGAAEARESAGMREIRRFLNTMRTCVDGAVAEAAESERDRRSRAGADRIRLTPVDLHGSPTPLGLGMIVASAIAYRDGVLDDKYWLVPEWMTPKVGPRPVGPGPAVFLFSNYLWSHRVNLDMSALIKQLPGLNVTIHGGPDTPKYDGDVETYFRLNPHVDVTVHGEGEATIGELLEAIADPLLAGRLDLSVLGDVPGLSFRLGDRVVRTAKRDRIVDLDTIPSPYLTGLFDLHAQAGTEFAIVETNRGCPYGCTFCDWGSATLSRIRKFDLQRVFDELEWIARHEIPGVFPADANFGIFERDVLIAEKVAELKRTYGFPKSFGTNYAKNTTKHLKTIVSTLVDAGVQIQGLLSLQSMDAGTLEVIRRSNIKTEKYDDLAREFRTARLPLLVDLMLGLPGSTVESFSADLQSCVNREVTAKIFPTEMLVNSPMNEPGYRTEHAIETSAPPSGLMTTIEGSDGTRRRAFVVSTATFTRDDYGQMLDLRRTFRLSENFGVLRQVSRFVRQETGLHEVALYDQLRRDARRRPDQWPTIDFTLRVVPFIGTMPLSWRVFIDEVRRYLVSVVGVVDDALETVLRVQHALLPSRDRKFPVTVHLDHDYASWFGRIIDAKDAGRGAAWELEVPRLREFGPADFVVDDTHEVCMHGVGFNLDIHEHATWELDSPVARSVPHEHVPTR
jgi:hypothetical protein